MSRLIRPTRNLFKDLGRLSATNKISKLSCSVLARHSTEQALLNYPSTQVTVLDNGMKIATENSGGHTATVGLYVKAGSRADTENNHGVANFLQHMLLKGTSNRSQKDLSLEVENMGALLNAYTNKEQTAFYAKCFSGDVQKAVNILADIIRNSKLQESDIESTKDTLLEYSKSRQENFQHLVMDHLHSIAYQGTSLGPLVTGSEHDIENMGKKQLTTFMEDIYQPANLVLAAAGGVDHDSLVKLAETLFGDMKMNVTTIPKLIVSSRYTGSDVKEVDETMPLAYVAIAQEGAGWNEIDKLPLMVAQTLIGDFDLTHRGLEWAPSNLARYCRDIHLAKSFHSFNINYHNTGLFGIYFVLELKHIGCFQYNLVTEWKRLCINPGDGEVVRAKNSLRTNLLLQMNGTTNICDDIGTQVLRTGRRLSPGEISKQIEAITTEEVKEVMYERIYDKCPAVASVGNIDYTFDYLRVRADMYWVRV